MLSTNSNNTDGSLMTMFNKKSLTWKEVKKLRKSGKVLALRFFEDGFWNTMKQLKIFITDSIRGPAQSFIQQKAIDEAVQTIEKAESSEPIPIMSKSTNGEVSNDFYSLLHLERTNYNVSPPIILYGRLFEEEGFQYVSFIFGQRVLIMEITTNVADIQERACETINAFIRKGEGIPKVSAFMKVQSNVAHIVAEINMQDENFILCESIPEDLKILNLTEIKDLIMASHYLAKKPLIMIKEMCVETLYFKQPFLEGYHIKKRVFGCIDPAKKNTLLSKQQIILVLCDAFTQSNFLWNEKPVTVSTKQFVCDVNYIAPKMPYQRIVLKPENVSSSEPGGIRYGDEILYDGPLDIIFE